MTKKPGGESAYPQATFDYTENVGLTTDTTGGLTKRELIAAMLMQGLMSNPEFVCADNAHAAHLSTEIAVNGSDALLLELSKPQSAPGEK